MSIVFTPLSKSKSAYHLFLWPQNALGRPRNGNLYNLSTLKSWVHSPLRINSPPSTPKAGPIFACSWFWSFCDESGTAVAVAVGNEVTMVCIENTVEREADADDALDIVRVETGVLVTIVVVAFCAQTALIRAAKRRATYAKRIVKRMWEGRRCSQGRSRMRAPEGRDPGNPK